MHPRFTTVAILIAEIKEGKLQFHLVCKSESENAYSFKRSIYIPSYHIHVLCISRLIKVSFFYNTEYTQSI